MLLFWEKRRKKRGLILLFLSIFFILLLPKTYGSVERPFDNSEFLEVEGVTLHYRQWIPERVEGSILLVHGLGGSTFSWRYNVESLLEKGYHVLAVDLPAFGYSDRQKGLIHSQENRSLWLWQLLERVAPEVDTWHLTGHSMGGGTIGAMALMEPCRVASMIYIAGAVGDRSPGWSRVFRYFPFRQVFSLVARVLLRESRIESALTSAYGTRPDREDIMGYLEPLQRRGTATAFADLISSTSMVSIDGLKELKIPSLLIWGEEDTWVPLSQGEALKENLYRAQLLVLESGHCPQETHPREVNEAIIVFLGSL